MQQLRAAELPALVEAGPAVLLDVREPWELALARIELPGTTLLHVPMMQIPARLSEIDRTQPVVCICHHGVRSAQVVAFLVQQGFETVYNLAGGLEAWSLEVDPGTPRY